MAKFVIHKLNGYGPITSVCWQEKWWNPWSWKSYAWRSMDRMGHAYLMVGKTMIRELKGKVDKPGYIFECDAPDGEPWVITVDGAECVVERLD